MHGPLLPLPSDLFTLIPTATYTVGSADHTLDGFLGTLRIDDRAGTGVLLLDDSAANPLVHAANSDILTATVTTAYQVTGGSISRTRSFAYNTLFGPQTDQSVFQIEEPAGIASVQVLAGGGTNTFSIYSLPSSSTRLVGGPGTDVFNRYENSSGGTGTLSLVGNGGNDTFRYDDSPLADYTNSDEHQHHDLNYSLNFDTATTGSLYRVDHNTGYAVGPFGTINSWDWYPTDNVTFGGIENIAILGPQGSQEYFAVTGNTSSNLSITTGMYSWNGVSVTAPAPTSPRGSLSITGPGDTNVTLNTGTLDFPSLLIQAGNGNLTLDDSQSNAAHHYVIDQGSIIRDGVVFNISAFDLTMSGGLGNDVFDLKSSTTASSFSYIPETQINGGAGNDTFNLAHDVHEGTSTLRRSLDGYLANLIVDGGTGTNTLVLDDSGSVPTHLYTIGSNPPGAGPNAPLFTHYTRDQRQVVVSENVSNATLLAAGNSVNASTIQVQSLDAAVALAITAPAVDSVVLGTPRILWDPTTGNYHADGASMDSVLGTITVHSTGSGPSVLVDDSASTTGRPVSITSSSISGYGTGRISLTGFTPGKVSILGGSGDDLYNILGQLSGLTISAGAGNDTFKLSNGKGVTGKIDGGAGTNTLDYSLYSTGVTVNLITGTATAMGGGIANIQNVTGSPASDTITGNTSSNVIIGNGGTDKLNGGGGGTDLFVLAPTQGSGSQVTGAGTTDTIQSSNIANTWTISGTNAGTLNGIAFTGIANLTGGTSTDSFKFTTGSVTGKIDGGAGADTLDYSGDGGSAVTANLATDTATKTGGFASIENIVGSSSTADTLIAANPANTWTISALNGGTVGAFTFSAIENLTGGTGADAFKFTTGSVTGKIDGGTGTDTLDYSGDGGAAVTVNLATSTTTKTGGFANIEKIVGSSSTADTLIGANAANTWTISAANGGTVGAFTFSAIENLTGGTGADAFKFTTGSVSGKIDGGAGTDTLDYSGDGGVAVTVNLATGTATKTGGFANIENVVGSSSTADTLIGANAANTWTISAANGGTVGAFTFSSIENLTGGTGADTFKFTTGSVTGKIDGGAGTDTLDFSGDGGAAATVNLATAKATKTGGFANIENLVGSSSTADTLIGANAANTWTISAANGGTLGAFTFSAIENLTGGTGADAFKFTTGSVTGKIDGGAGTDTLDYSGDGGVAVTVNLATSTATKTGGFANIENVVGSSSTADTLIGANAANTWTISALNVGTVGAFSFSAVENLTGGTGADAFKFTTGSVTGKIDGGAGTDTLDYSGDGGVAVTVNLATSTATKTGGFANIEHIVGSSSTADTLIGANAANTWTISALNVGTVGAFSFSAVENLTGGTGADAFKFTTGSVTGKIDGGAGTDTLDYSGDGGVAVTVNLATGTATKTGGFANIENVVGSSSTADMLIGANGSNTWSITGSNRGHVGAVSFSSIDRLVGGSGLDTLDYSTYTTAVTVNLATGTATDIDGGVTGFEQVILPKKGS